MGILKDIYESVSNNVANILSIIISGLLSWFITHLYYHKSNKNEAYAFILEPIDIILNDVVNYENFNNLVSISKNHAMKYLSVRQRNAINSVIISYNNVKCYNVDKIDSESIQELFYKVLNENKINYKLVPLRDNNDEIVDYDIPDDLRDIHTCLEQKFRNEFDYEFDNSIRQNIINQVLNDYKNKYIFKSESLNFFKNSSLENVLKNSKVAKCWDEKLQHYKSCTKKFYIYAKLRGKANEISV